MREHNNSTTPSPHLLKLLPFGWLRFSSDGKILAANPEFVNLLQYPDQNTLLQANAWDFFSEPSIRNRAQDRSKTLEDIRKLETMLRCYTDDVIWVELSVHIEDDEPGLGMRILQCVVHDITPQKRTLQALRETSRLKKTLLQNISEGIVIYDREFRYQGWNTYMEKVSGLRSSQVLGSTIQDAFPGWDNKDVEQVLCQVLAGETISRNDIPFNVPFTGSSGRYNAVYHPQIASNGEITGIIAFIRDLTNDIQWETKYGHIQMDAYKQRMRAEALGRIILSAGVLQELPPLLNLICNELAVYLNMDAVNICVLQARNLVCIASHGFAEETLRDLNISLSAADHFAVKTFREERILFWNEFHHDGMVINEKLRALLQGKSILALPLLATGKVVGVLTLIDSQQSRVLEGDDLEFVMQIGHQSAIAIESVSLFEKLKEANVNLMKAYDATLAGWAKALELRDQETEGHTQRVAKLTLELAQHFAIDKEELTSIYQGAILHDIGKMGIPDNILLKPGVLNEAEREIMRRHPVYAYEMLKPIDYLHPALDIPYCHHEKWDGTGYPRGLKGDEIPLTARIFSVVDVWDALTSARPYRGAWDRESALDYIRAEAGKYFDPRIVEKFIKIIQSGI